MAAVLPRNLALIVQRLANFNRTTIRVRAQSNDAARAGQTISFRLPTNTLIDLHNLQLYGKIVSEVHARIWPVDAEGDVIPNASPETRKFWAGLPSRMNQIFERIDVVINGQVITGNNTDYGGIDHLMFEHTYETGRTAGSFLEGGRGLAVRAGGEFALMNSRSGSKALSESFDPAPFVVNKFSGFLGGDHVRFIDTAVLGPVEIRLRLAPNNILSINDQGGSADPGATATDPNPTPIPSPAGPVIQNAYIPGTQDFVVSDMYMLIDTVSFADDFYRAILAKRLMDGGIIQIPYTNYFSIQKHVPGGGNEFVTFNIATQSLDYLIATFRRGSYNNNMLKNYADDPLPGEDQVAPGNAAFYTFKSGGGQKATYQFMINNQMAPTWPADINEAYVLTRAALDLIHTKDAVGNVATFNDYIRSSFMFMQCFKHHTGYGNNDTIISGLDTRGASSNMAFVVNGLLPGGTTGDSEEDQDRPGPVGAAWNVTVWAQTTSTLEISAGQNIVTIF